VVVGAKVEKVTPQKGKVGSTTVLHGSGLTGTHFVIKFGRTEASGAANPGNSSDNIKCEVPAKDARDPSPVQITIVIDGVPAELPPGGLTFEYNVPLPEPMITGVVGVTHAPDLAVNLSLEGENFVTPQRQPDAANIYLVGLEDQPTVQGLVESFTEATLTASFSEVLLAGMYQIVAGFTDGAGATSPPFMVN
jgi:hypothetical protein